MMAAQGFAPDIPTVKEKKRIVKKTKHILLIITNFYFLLQSLGIKERSRAKEIPIKSC